MILQKLKDYYSKTPLPARAAIWFTACNFLLKGLGFITGPLFTRILPAEEYGKSSVFLSYQQIILILATWEIYLGAYQKGIFKYKKQLDLFTTSVLALINSLTIILFALIFIFYDFVTTKTGMTKSILALLLIYLLFIPAYHCWLARKRKEYDYKKVVSATVLSSFLSVIAQTAALYVVGKTANVRFGTSLIVGFCFCCLFYFPYSNYSILKSNWKRVKAFWRFCVRFEGPLVLHSLSFLILAQADRVMIGNMVGNSQAAFYSVAYSIANVVIILQNSVNQALNPWRFQKLEDKNYLSISKVTTSLLLFISSLIICFIMVVPECMRLLFPANYYEAIWCIPPISASVYFMFLYSIFVNIEEYYERTKYVVYVSVVCGLLNIVLNYFCISKFGYISCAYTTLISYILFALGHYYFMSKTLREVYVKDQVINKKAVFAISFLLVAVSVAVTTIYDNAYLRYCLFALLICTLLFYRKNIMQIVNQLKHKKEPI